MDQRIKAYRKALALAVIAAGSTLATGTSNAGSLAVVTSSAELSDALNNGESHIMIPPSVQMLYVDETLHYAGSEALTILGSGQTIRATGDFDLLSVDNGADLTVSGVHFEGPGGFDIYHQGTGKGIFVDVPQSRHGVVQLALTDVTVSGFAYYGVFVSDCTGGDACGAGGGSGGDGSPASVAVYFDNVTITEVGTGRFDGDGLRVNERSEGGISFIANRSSFMKAGADGVELDEDDDEVEAEVQILDAVPEAEVPGNVVVNVTDSIFDDNGSYCNPDILESFLPEPDEAEYEEAEMVPPPDWYYDGFGSPDDSCLEVSIEFYDRASDDDPLYVKEFEVAIDTDDGFDIDEAGPGSVNTVMTDSQINGNYDEGVDFDEAGPGGFMSSFVKTVAYYNADDGFKLSEEDEGDVLASLYMVQSRSNGGKGAVFEEENDGDLDVTLDRVKTHKNDDNEVGIEVVQDDDGDGLLTVRDSNIKETEEDDGIEADGVTIVRE